MASLNFCDLCDSLQMPENNDGVMQLVCINCGNKTAPVKDRVVIHRNYMKKAFNKEYLTDAMIYDTALRHTSRIRCPNTACDCHDMSKWGKPSSSGSGIIVQPDVVQTNFTSPDKTAVYICRICNTKFAPSNK